MVKTCIYCKTPLDDNSVVDVCSACGKGVWGEKMFNAIIDNMEAARSSGNLHQGSISNDNPSPETPDPSPEPSNPQPEPVNPSPEVPSPEPTPPNQEKQIQPISQPEVYTEATEFSL